MAKHRHPARIRFRLHPDQKVALEKLAHKRGVNCSTLLREAIAGLTGVPDPLPRMPQYSRDYAETK